LNERKAIWTSTF